MTDHPNAFTITLSRADLRIVVSGLAEASTSRFEESRDMRGRGFGATADALSYESYRLDEIRERLQRMLAEADARRIADILEGDE